jgi:hypothetical protein
LPAAGRTLKSALLLRTVWLSANALSGNILGRQYFMLQSEHAGRRLIYTTGKSNGALQDWFEASGILNSGGWILMLHDELCIGYVQLK